MTASSGTLTLTFHPDCLCQSNSSSSTERLWLDSTSLPLCLSLSSSLRSHLRPHLWLLLSVFTSLSVCVSLSLSCPSGSSDKQKSGSPHTDQISIKMSGITVYYTGLAVWSMRPCSGTQSVCLPLLSLPQFPSPHPRTGSD